MIKDSEKNAKQSVSCPKLINPTKYSVTVVQNKRRTENNQMKCKFFPFCTKTNCKYYHPIADCKFFPNCKLGLSCLYKHKSCRYGGKCTNVNCVYSHPPIPFLEKQMIAHIKGKSNPKIAAH